jgi:hypothetical protein
MKQPNKTYVGAAIYYERLADNGWFEDADGSLLGEIDARPAQRSPKREAEVDRPSLLGVIMSLLQVRAR